MAIVLGVPGTWTETFTFVVTAEQSKAYAAATNETDHRLRTGELAPPLFATVPVRGALRAVFAHAMPGGLPPSVPRLAGEQDMIFHAPIVPGMVLSSRAGFLGISPKSSGTALAFKLETRTESALINEQYMTTFLPGVRWHEELGEHAPSHPIPVEVRTALPIRRIVQRFDADQTYRFSAASGDPSLMHLDNEKAKLAGFPGIIIHGLCTMAFIGRAVVESVGDGDVLRLKRLALRFSRPIFPGNDMVTMIWPGIGSDGGKTYFCEAAGPDDQRVITNGFAELST